MAEFINVKNFGPLKSGTKKFIPIKKCSIIIGDQGSGKSTLVKLFSSMLWLEKALMRENYKV